MLWFNIVRIRNETPKKGKEHKGQISCKIFC